MTGLLDIALATEQVAGVTITGVSAHGVSYLLARFPEIRSLMTGREMTFTVDRIMLLAPEAIAAIIAVGCGNVPDGPEGSADKQTKVEAKAATLPVGMQVEFLEAVLRLTMPGGVGPFVARLNKLADFAAEGFGKEAGTKSPPQS